MTSTAERTTLVQASAYGSPMESFFHWRPIEAPADPVHLADGQVRALSQLWRAQRARLDDSATLASFNDRLARSWSIETGVLERLYDVSAGTTRLLIEHGFLTTHIQHGETTLPADQLVQVLNDHRDALDMVMDLVGGQRRLSTGWIKELHALITRSQSTSEAVTSLGQVVQVPLQHGAYKSDPNNPTRAADGRIHEYCPPAHVAAEMDRLIEIYASIPDDVPEVRSAWLHHAFTQIHPFQDGNGRVARALASIDFIRSGLFPLIVMREDRDSLYLPALADADAGNLRTLVNFFVKCLVREMTKAISIAEGVIAPAENLSTVLAAAKRKVQDREAITVPLREEMRTRLAKYAKFTEYAFEEARTELSAAIPKIEARISKADDQTAHYFFAQTIEIARRGQYWADMNEPRHWVRLQLRNGGVTDVIVILHFVGNPAPGSCMASIFLEHRGNLAEATGAVPLARLPVEPLLLTVEEAYEAQSLRFTDWVKQATVQALAEWTRYL